MCETYPRLKATLIQPGAIVLNVFFIEAEEADAVPLIVNEVVGDVEEAHALIRPLAAARGIPPERVDIDAEHLG